MIFKLSDYKGKYFVIQDFIDPEDFYDYECGEIEESAITDSWLKNHVENSIYYGIPAYLGDNEELKGRIKEIEDKLICPTKKTKSLRVWMRKNNEENKIRQK